MSVLMTTVADEREANSLSEMLINKKLAACVQEIQVNSRFRWQNKVQQEHEVLLFIKTAVDKVDSAIDAIKSQHSYDLPEIISLPVKSGLPAYVDWVQSETRTPADRG